MARKVNKNLRTFFFVLFAGILFLLTVMKMLSSPGKVPIMMPGFQRVNNQTKVSNDVPPSQSPYLFMKNEREALVRRAYENGEDLRIRGKLFKLYRPIFTCPYNVTKWGDVRVGGAKFVCGAQELYSKTDGTCVVYSFGVDGDSSFEAEILNNTDCTVYAYDHTVDSISKPLRPDNQRVKFWKYGLADYSTLGRINFKTVKQVMTMNGHSWIDILKVDVEGSEFDAISMLMDDFGELPIGQLQVELHVWVKNDSSKIYSKTVPWLNRLEERGLRTFGQPLIQGIQEELRLIVVKQII